MDQNLATRRIFLQRGLALLAAAPTIPTFLDQTVMALASPFDISQTQLPSGKDGKILVVVQLGGGNDGLSMVVPYGDDAYYNARTRISHPANTILKINDYLGLHPSLTGIKDLYDNGDLAIVQGVGYPNPNRSHFRAMDIWQSGQPQNDSPGDGWIGRYFDNTCPGCDPHVGVSVGQTLPLAMQGDHVMPLNLERPESYRYNGHDKMHYLELNQVNQQTVSANSALGNMTVPVPIPPGVRPPESEATQLDFLHRTAMDAQLSSDQIFRVLRNHVSASAYPAGEFGGGLKMVASMIAGGMPTRVYYVTLTGFDTHSGQLNRHDTLMKQLGDGLGAFWKDLKAQKNDDRVMVMTFSEFGRRVEENASNGTDHGAAAPMFVLGGSIQQGLVGNHPSLTDLDQGDLKFGVDFRSVYASILQDWLETPSKPILGDQFSILPLVKT
jgi:uncharacterized protein (DUF1501 family)